MNRIERFRSGTPTAATTAQEPATPAAAPAPRPQRPATPAATKAYDYNGIPFPLINNLMLRRLGYQDGIVPEGARNTTLYTLARELRYITDFSVNRTMAVLPDLGLAEDEVRETVKSAIGSMRASKMPPMLKGVLEELEKPKLDTIISRRKYLERINPVPKKMPWLFDYIYHRFGGNGRAALSSALPMLGTLLGRYEAPYLDDTYHKPVFMCVVMGYAGSGKSFITKLQKLLLSPIMEQDALGREELTQWTKKKEEVNGKKQLTAKPTPCIRVLSATSSNGQLLQVAQNALGQPVFVITEEIDEAARSSKSGAWADKSDIFRKAFDGANWGQDYMTYNGNVDLYMNLMFAGTYVSVRKFFSDVENGLMTRFIFVEMDDDRGKMIRRRKAEDKKDDAKAEALVRKLYELGCTTTIPHPDNVLRISLPQALDDAEDFNNEKIEEYLASGPDNEHRDSAIDQLRRRSAVVLFRASLLCYILEGMKETDEGRAMANWFANETYLQQYIMFADEINQSRNENQAIQRRQDIAAERAFKASVLEQLLEELPAEFSNSDLSQLMQVKNFAADSAGKYIQRMIKKGLVSRIKRNLYTKNYNDAA